MTIQYEAVDKWHIIFDSGTDIILSDKEIKDIVENFKREYFNRNDHPEQKEIDHG